MQQVVMRQQLKPKINMQSNNNFGLVSFPLYLLITTSHETTNQATLPAQQAWPPKKHKNYPHPFLVTDIGID